MEEGREQQLWLVMEPYFRTKLSNDEFATWLRDKEDYDWPCVSHLMLSAMYCCCTEKDSICAVQECLKYGYDVNERDEHRGKCGGTALYFAVREANIKHTTLLLHCGADTNTPGVDDEMPFYYAIDNNLSMEIVELLFQHNAHYRNIDRTKAHVWRTLAEFDARIIHRYRAAVAILSPRLRRRLGWPRDLARMVARIVWSRRREKLK